MQSDKMEGVVVEGFDSGGVLSKALMEEEVPTELKVLLTLTGTLTSLLNTPLKIPPPAALVEGISLRWFILRCEYCISISEIRAHTCYQTCYQSRR
jgi:hypothetical protein